MKPCRVCAGDLPCKYNHDQRTPDEIRMAPLRPAEPAAKGEIKNDAPVKGKKP